VGNRAARRAGGAGLEALLGEDWVDKAVAHLRAGGHAHTLFIRHSKT